MTLSVRCGYRKMQPIFFSFVSGLHYRKTVKLYFCRISTIYLLVSIYENVFFRLFSSFLTAGNKSKCGTLQRLTHSQQSTVEAIFRPVSLPKRQAMQGKPFALSSIHPRTSSHLRKHRTSVPSRPQKLPGALIRTKSAPQTLPQLQPQPHPSRSQATPSHASIRPSRTPPSAPTLPPHLHPRHTPDAPFLRTHTPSPPPATPRHPLPPHPHSLPTPNPHAIPRQE